MIRESSDLFESVKTFEYELKQMFNSFSENEGLNDIQWFQNQLKSET